MGNTNKNSLTSFGVSKMATAEEVVEGIDLQGKNVVITGTSDGLGKECARVFYKKGCRLFVLNRNVEKANLAMEEIVENNTTVNAKVKGKIFPFYCDLASQTSVILAAEQLRKFLRDVKIDILLCNAGVMAVPFSLTEDKFESTIGICHYGHFTLILSLLNMMNDNSRIHIVSSRAHYLVPNCGLNLNDMHFQNRKYYPWKSYGHAKMANLYLCFELDRLLKLSKKKIICHCSHPGGVMTNLGNENSCLTSIKFLLKTAKELGIQKRFKGVDQGASSMMLACTHPKANIGGKYFGCFNDYEESSERSKDTIIAKRFFKMSLKDTGMKWPWKINGEDINDLKNIKGSIL